MVLYGLIETSVLVVRDQLRRQRGRILEVYAWSVIFERVDGAGDKHHAELIGTRVQDHTVIEHLLVDLRAHGLLVHCGVAVLCGIVLRDDEKINRAVLHKVERADIEAAVKRAAVKIVFKRRGIYLGFQLRKLVRVTHAELFEVRQTADMVNLFAVKLIVIRLLIVGGIFRAAHDALERVQLYLRVLFTQFF